MLFNKISSFFMLNLFALPLMAGTMGAECQVSPVTTPCANNSWGIGAQALYLKANFSSLGYIGSLDEYNIPFSYEENYVAKDFKYGFGFEIEAFYQFEDGRDLNLNWYHYKHTTNQSLTSGINVYDNLFTGNVLLKLNPEWDALNLELGQKLNIYSSWKIRLHSGLQYADIQLSNVTTASDIYVGHGKIRSNNSSYSGVGPRVGMDIAYGFKKISGFDISSNFAGGLLIGSHNFNRKVITYKFVGTMTDGNNGSSNSIVTVFDIKLGGAYHHSFARGDLRLDAGWMVVDYFNPIEIADSFHNGRTKESNFAVQGPYFGLKWNGIML